MTVPILIPGFTSSDRVPGAVAYTVYGNGQQSIGDAPLLCAVIGGMGATGGTATPDASVVQVFSPNDADSAFVAGSEIAMMCYSGLQNESIALFAIPTAAPTGSPASATLTATVGGTWTQGGTIFLRVGGIPFQINVGAADSTTNVATNMASTANGVPRNPFSAAPASAVVTFTILQKGARGNDYVAAVDLTKAPPGLTCVLAGGSALTGGVTPFSAGTGADSVVNVLAILANQTWDFQAWAQHDNTNAALINTQLSAQAGPLVMHPGFAVFAHGRSPAAAITFSQTILNQQLACVVQHTNSETPPHQIAAFVAGMFSISAGDNPNTRYVNVPCSPAVAPQSQPADVPGRSSLNTMLNSGVTPLITKNGKVYIVDAVCAHSLNGSSQDLRTYHVGDVFVPIRVQKELVALWDTVSSVNPYAGPDPAPGQNPPPEGVITPQRWLANVNKALLDFQKNNWLEQVETHPAIAVWDSTAKRIMTAVPEYVRSQNIQMGLVGNQTASS